ncbi:Protein DDX26B [Zancudomyces culisetae]|uniref:Protein DDX26B n=1 Tax=Zancudomyces culisetae TaxID=1213189 RepID=A0A1R1PFW9_ZANCU|nr:Protein DDX26B [Zancudomyces culisetae]OMH82329.1 Protein DDX26B [Zancudomyces culisetae]|eukprot:OMH79874.1 Protein DDX26B [Zancudomyces culisetae]
MGRPLESTNNQEEASYEEVRIRRRKGRIIDANSDSCLGTNGHQQIKRKFRSDGPSRLDCAKSIAEQILQKLGNQPNDRYMLITYDESGESCIKSNFKDSQEVLLAKISELRAVDKVNAGNALSTIFEQLRMVRLAYDIDTYGQGRYPMLHELTNIIWLTDGTSIINSNGGLEKLNIPATHTYWTEMYQEPFRWDQRMFILFLHEQDDRELCYKGFNSSEHLLSPMSVVMGGSGGIFHIGSAKQAHKVIEQLCPPRKIIGAKPLTGMGLLSTAGVVVNFEKLPTDSAPVPKASAPVLLMIHESNIINSSIATNKAQNQNIGVGAGTALVLSGTVGYFPIPESFWPDSPKRRPVDCTPEVSIRQVPNRSIFQSEPKSDHSDQQYAKRKSRVTAVVLACLCAEFVPIKQCWISIWAFAGQFGENSSEFVCVTI